MTDQTTPETGPITFERDASNGRFRYKLKTVCIGNVAHGRFYEHYKSDDATPADLAAAGFVPAQSLAEARAEVESVEAAWLERHKRWQDAEGMARADVENTLTEALAQLAAERAKREHLEEAILTATSADQTWPLADVLARLAEFANDRLTVHGYDGHGWEELHRCRDEALAMLPRIRSLCAIATDQQSSPAQPVEGGKAPWEQDNAKRYREERDLYREQLHLAMGKLRERDAEREAIEAEVKKWLDHLEHCSLDHLAFTKCERHTFGMVLARFKMLWTLRLDALRLRSQPTPTGEAKDSSPSPVASEPTPVAAEVAPLSGAVVADAGDGAGDPLHPDGRCTCGGGGECDWCKAHCPSCGSPESNWTIAPVMSYFTPAATAAEVEPPAAEAPLTRSEMVKALRKVAPHANAMAPESFLEALADELSKVKP